MAKAQPFMSVTVSVSKQDLGYAAEIITYDLFEEFDSEVFEMLDFKGKAFREELLDFEPFLECVREAVARGGMEALDSPQDYMDFDTVYRSKEWKSLFGVCEQLQEILNDIDYEESRARKSSDCAEAIETLKRAGFKIVKA